MPDLADATKKDVLAYATEDDLKGQGFPKLFQAAFLRTADEVQSVVLCRTPGGATTRILEENYDLKAFFVKAKSCNWGPMGGFLCQVPILSKKGLKGIEYNTREMLHYLETFEDRGNPPSEVTVGTPQPALPLPDRIEKILIDAGLVFADAIKGAWNHLKNKSIVDLGKFLELKNEDIYNAFLNISSRKDPIKQEKLERALQDLRVLIGPKSPFVPLKITQARLGDILKNKSMPAGYRRSIGSGSDYYGIAFHEWTENGEPDIIMDYFIKKVGKLYELYFGEIGYRAYKIVSKIIDGREQKLKVLTEVGQWKHFPDKISFALLPGFNERQQADQKIIDEIHSWDPKTNAKPRLFPAHPVPFKFTDKDLKAIDNVRKNFCKERIGITFNPSHLFARSPKDGMYPVQGLQNYYPPYAGDDRYKNAVTGDYDLFAIWPNKMGFGLRELTRQSEIDNEADTTFFYRVSGKVYTLQSTVSPNIYVEFIPGFGEIRGKEHLSYGNFSSLGTLCAGTLNSYVAVARKKLGKTSPNAAFHSDEGGRPGIDDVEYPVAVFLPQDLAFELDPKTKKQTLLLDTHSKFLDLILVLKDKCLLPLNFVWLHDMLKYAYSEEKDASDVQQKLVTLFGVDEILLLELKNRFGEIFTEANKGRMSAEKMAYVLNGNWPAAAH